MVKNILEELNCLAVSALGTRSWKLRSKRSFMGWVTKIYYLELLRASEGTLSRSSRLYMLQG
jgi:hypothetical protein